jgi:hypothetical protein
MLTILGFSTLLRLALTVNITKQYTLAILYKGAKDRTKISLIWLLLYDFKWQDKKEYIVTNHSIMYGD